MASSAHLSGLTDTSKNIIDQFFKWSKLSLDKLHRNLLAEASTYGYGTLPGDQQTFTQAEVKQILGGQLDLISGYVTQQVDCMRDCVAEVMRAVLAEADRLRVPINVDIQAILGNAGGVGAMRAHGRALMDGPNMQLKPLTLEMAGGEASRQLMEANAEISRLRVKMQQLSDRYQQVMTNKSDETSQLLSTTERLEQQERQAASLQYEVQQQQQRTAAAEAASAAYAKQIADYQAQQTHAASLAQQQQLQQAQQQQRMNELSAALERLKLEVMESKQELNRRLHQSSQYQQTRAILTKKNIEIKGLKAKLAQYDPSYLQAAESIPTDED